MGLVKPNNMETTIKEFKGTKGPLEKKFVGPICIGIGTTGEYSQITANSILPETDEEYDKEKEELEANMQLYANAPKLLEALQEALELLEGHQPNWYLRKHYNKFESAISSAIGE